jgi:hypothetical protein
MKPSPGATRPALGHPSNSADHLIIAPAMLEAAAQELADYRSATGLESRVVKLQSIYDEYNCRHRRPARHQSLP